MYILVCLFFPFLHLYFGSNLMVILKMISTARTTNLGLGTSEYIIFEAFFLLLCFPLSKGQSSRLILPWHVSSQWEETLAMLLLHSSMIRYYSNINAWGYIVNTTSMFEFWSVFFLVETAIQDIVNLQTTLHVFCMGKYSGRKLLMFSVSIYTYCVGCTVQYM